MCCYKVKKRRTFRKRSGSVLICVCPWTMGARSRYFRWMRGKQRSGTQVTVRGIKESQLGENELRYVAWGACFHDSISTLRDGMRCTESKLTFICCTNNPQVLTRLERRAPLCGGDQAADSVWKTWYSTVVRFLANSLTRKDLEQVILR